MPITPAATATSTPRGLPAWGPRLSQVSWCPDGALAAQQQARLLPCPYFLVTFTLPAELRPLAFANQKKVYGLLMRSAAAALQKLALDPQYLGGRLGALAVLHTWTRAMLYHPHACW